MERKEEKKKEKNIGTEKALENCQKERDEYLAGWKRAQADFLNYKKEEAGRKEELLKYANEKLILKLLPILDNFYIAEKEMPKKLKEDQWAKGILKIKEQILEFLKREGVEAIESLGKEFNPIFHEAVEMVEKEGEKEGTIVEEVRKGYFFQDKILRPAKVKIAK